MRAESWKRPTLLALAASAIVVAAVAVLLGMGRSPWGAAPGPGLWSGDADGPLTSQLLADPYTLSHVGHGLLFFLLLHSIARKSLSLGVRWVLAIGLESLWEIVENTPFVIERFREATIARGYYGDSVLNVVGDILACALGCAAASGMGPRWTLVGFVALEVLLAVWIRDNITLNVIMLIHPVPEILEWQSG
jgi:hypothetical protein